jgi:hypothetical protein
MVQAGRGCNEHLETLGTLKQFSVEAVTETDHDDFEFPNSLKKLWTTERPLLYVEMLVEEVKGIL